MPSIEPSDPEATQEILVTEVPTTTVPTQPSGSTVLEIEEPPVTDPAVNEEPTEEPPVEIPPPSTFMEYVNVVLTKIKDSFQNTWTGHSEPIDLVVLAIYVPTGVPSVTFLAFASFEIIRFILILIKRLLELPFRILSKL